MFIQRNTKRVRDKVYHSVLLREGYREDGKIKMRTLLNISAWPKEKIDDLSKVLAGKRVVSPEEAELSSGRSFGGLWALKVLADRLGITEALGNSRWGKLCLFMVFARIINQGSRLAAVAWAKEQAVREVLDIGYFDEDDLYAALDWLDTIQDDIEDALFLKRDNSCDLFLYDVTSTYLEGQKNELAAFGYNRDKKKGKKQIVVGLLTDKNGFPISAQVFSGNTGDPATLTDQVDKVATRFKAKSVTFVGDKGLVKKVQRDHLTKTGYHYITSITKAEIQALADRDIIQLSLFDNDIVEVADGPLRYILRKNPIRAKEVKENRTARLKRALVMIDEETKGLENSKRRDPDKALRRVIVGIDKLGLSRLITVNLTERLLSFAVDQEALNQASILDGCYVIKSDLPKEKLTANEIHDRYKDLARVETAFRTMKTAFLEVRPVFLRKASRTRGHVFVTMLAYCITHELEKLTKSLDMTRAQIISMLERIQISDLKFDKLSISKIATPDSDQQEVLDALEVKMPSSVAALLSLTRTAPAK